MRLPQFLAHYRRLGVAQFLVIDNDSTDGSADLLRRQPDVSLWTTKASYRRSRFGVDWTNWLLLRHGHGHWCLTVDADELLVYPHWETRPLPALTAWLDSTGARSFAAMMLDMYPEGPLSAQDYRAGDDPLDILRWFDAGNYSLTVQPRLRNLWVQGGPRARAFFASDPRRAPTLNKLPLVKWHWRYAYHNSTHTILPPPLNAVFDETGGEMTSARCCTPSSCTRLSRSRAKSRPAASISPTPPAMPTITRPDRRPGAAHARLAPLYRLAPA